MHDAIGIFDSGIGGLTVLRAVHERYPAEQLVYLGDTARVPYGTKGRQTVAGYALQAAEFLLRQRIKLLIVACNTASAVALDSLAAVLPIPVLGVIEPGAARAAQLTQSGRVGVIATEGTVQSQAYPAALRRFNPRIEPTSVACPLFVPLVEAGWANHPVAHLTAQDYLTQLESAAIDTLVLGCTHYPLLQATLEAELGPGVRLVDSAAATAAAIADLPDVNLRPSGTIPAPRFYVTDTPERFCRIGSNFLGHPLQGVCQVDLEAELDSLAGGR